MYRPLADQAGGPANSAGPLRLWNPFTWADDLGRADFRMDVAAVDAIVSGWARTCEGVGLLHRTDTVSGPTTTTPDLVDITLGPPPVLTVRLLPGQIMADVEAVASRLGPPFGVRRFVVAPIWDRMHVRLVGLDHDPLTQVVPYRVPGDGRNFLGCTEEGLILVDDWAGLPHTLVQGVTRSGKSAWLYAQLAQWAAHGRVVVAGSDPSGRLWRPWTGHPGAHLRVSGLRDVADHAQLLESLCAEMDRRIDAIPDDADTADLTDPASPLMVIVLEEYAGLLRAADAVDTKIGKRIRAAVSRLLAESHKAGIRMVLVTQRAEAAVVGGFERAMCELRLSFRVDNADTLRLLHPIESAVERLDEHVVAPDGVALLTAPGAGLLRIRGPWIGGYREYLTAVTAVSR